MAVRAVTEADRPEDREISLSLASGENLRVLLIFAEAPGSRPRAMRLERKRLLDMLTINQQPFAVRRIREERMSKPHFISYSAIDAGDFSLKLYDTLLAGPPGIPVWMDKRDIKAARDRDEEIVEAIRRCGSLLFVITRDSVSRQSVCKQEWSRAMKYKKPGLPP